MALPVRLLLVDDSIIYPQTLLQALQAGGYAPSYARVAGAKGLGEALAGGPWDVVLADPEPAGLGVADIASQLQAHALDIPLIALSESCRPERIVAAMRAGARDYLLKGDHARLVASIERELREAAERRTTREADQALREQGRILDTVDQAVAITDLDGAVHYWNRYAETLYGWSAAEAVGRNILDLRLGTATPERATTIMADLRAGREWTDESTMRHRDGTTFPAVVSRSPIFDQCGRQIGIIGFTRDLRGAEEALRASEAWHRALTEQATDLVAVLDAEGIFSYASPSYLRILGYDPRLVIGQQVLTKTHPDDAAALQRLWQGLFTTDEPLSVEFRLRHRDGSWRTLETTAVNRLTDPAVRGIIATSRDITARRRAEEARWASEARFRSLFEHAPIGVVLINGDGRFLIANVAAQHILGYDEAEFSRLTIADVTHPDDSTANRTLFEEVLSGEYGAVSRRKRYLHKDGHVVWVQLAASSIKDEDGAPRSMIGMLLDVTERYKAEAALRESEQRFRQLVEQAPIAISVTNVHGYFESVNPAYCDLYGYTADQLIGRHSSMIVPEERREVVNRWYQDSVETGLRVSGEYQPWTGDGRERTALITMFTMRGDDVDPVHVTFMVDITERKRMEEALRARERQLRAIASNAPLVLYAADLDGLTTLSLGGGLRHYGIAANAHVGLPIHQVFKPYPKMTELLDRAYHGESHTAMTEIFGRTFEAHWWPERDESDRVTGVTGLAVDLTDRVQAEAARERLAAIVEASEDSIIGMTPAGIIETWNMGATHLYGYTAEEAVGRPITILTIPAMHDQIPGFLSTLEEGTAPTHFETIHLRKDGRVVDVSITASALKDEHGRITAIATIARDITLRKQAETALAHQASHDALTNLANRAALHDRLGRYLARSERNVAKVALMLLDLDQFKEVNDTLGHPVGDRLLRAVSRRLEEALGGAELIARLGGDEFAIIVSTVDAGEAGDSAQLVLNCLKAPFVLDGQALAISASVGVAVADDQGLDVSTLLRRADVAMYAAKRTRSGHAVYDPSMDQQGPRRLALLHDLQEALSADRLVLHYQPKIAARTGRLLGVEALLRWPHPEHGFIPPDQFIPLAEQSGLIGPLTTWVLRQALDQYRTWQAAGTAIPVAVNLSTRNLQDSRLPEIIGDLLRQYAVPPEHLTLEVTETAVMADPVRARDVLGRLRDLGVRLSLDDFGTGYSSLGYLRDLPVDEVKIDKSFVRSIGSTDDAKDEAIVRAVILLSHALDLEVVGEGVETRRTWDTLSGLGCDTIQGYYISKPLPAAGLDQWLQDGRRYETEKQAVVGRAALPRRDGVALGADPSTSG
jgi:diguanylate cyclase (GGDEF)-like protein/PAS domain S-box-containing protein